MKMNHLNDIAAMRPRLLGAARTARKSRPHDTRNFRISLKQWRILHAVNDCGGFAGAAEFLHVSQSTVSYTLAKLQEQLGVPLLKIEGRKAQVTESGRALLERSRHLIKEALEIEVLAENLRKGWRSEVHLVVDHNFPTRLLMLSLREFSLLDYNIKVCLSEATLPEIEKALIERTADLAISCQVPPGFMGNPLIELENVAVAHPDHSLFRLQRTITAADLERQVQVAICSSKEPAYRNSHTLRYVQRWNVNSFDTAVEALRERLGYAWLPTHRVQKWLDQGKLAILPLEEERAYKMHLYLIHGRPWIPGSGASRLAELLHHLASTDSMDCNLRSATA
jgi:DNA-binding transcriptional LysR family regulator